MLCGKCFCTKMLPALKMLQNVASLASFILFLSGDFIDERKQTKHILASFFVFGFGKSAALFFTRCQCWACCVSLAAHHRESYASQYVVWMKSNSEASFHGPQSKNALFVWTSHLWCMRCEAKHNPLIKEASTWDMQLKNYC